MLSVGLYDNEFRVRTVIDGSKIRDMQSLIAFLCTQLGIPILDELVLVDKAGREIRSLPQLTKESCCILKILEQTRQEMTINSARHRNITEWSQLKQYEKTGIHVRSVRDPIMEGLSYTDRTNLAI